MLVVVVVDERRPRKGLHAGWAYIRNDICILRHTNLKLELVNLEAFSRFEPISYQIAVVSSGGQHGSSEQGIIV